MNYFDPHTKGGINVANQVAADFYEDLVSFVRGHGSNITWLGWGPAYGDVQKVGPEAIKWTPMESTPHLFRGL